MRLTKALGLAAIAAMLAMAFINTTAAVAQHDVVLCLQLEELCADGNLWPEGTEIFALAENVELVGTLPIVCEDSVTESTITSPGGIGSPLVSQIDALVFGVLPTPTLGAGCDSSICGSGIQMHPNGLPFASLLAVTGNDEYTYAFVGKVTMLCAGFTCGFAATKTTSRRSRTRANIRCMTVTTSPLSKWTS